MTRRNLQFLLHTVLCYIMITSVLVSYVKANFRARRSSHHSTSHSSHSSSNSRPENRRGLVTTQQHNYAASPGLSGNRGAWPGFLPHAPTNSMPGYGRGTFGHNYPPTNTMTGSKAQPRYVPHAPPNSMPGYGRGKSGHSYPPSKTMSGSEDRPGYVTLAPPNSMPGYGRGTSGHSYPPTNTMIGSGARPGYVPTGTQYTNVGTTYPQNPSIITQQGTSKGSNQPVLHVQTATNTVHHHHYIYRPPTMIHYSTAHGVSRISYPTYTGRLPPYVYDYRSSGNKYSYLLAGLALYNLGRISATSRANDYHQHYNPKPDEYCRFGVRYKTGSVEEMNIDCRAITYFIFETVKTQPQMQPLTETHVSTKIVNQTIVTTQTMLNTQMQVNAGNGVVVPIIQQVVSGNGAVTGNAQQVNAVTATTTQIIEVTDSRLLGEPVHVHLEMECYVTRIISFNNMQKPVPCGLLQEYAKSSFQKSSAVIAKSSSTLIVIAVVFMLY